MTAIEPTTSIRACVFACTALLLISLLSGSASAYHSESLISREDSLSAASLKGKTLEALMEIDVTTLGKTAESWNSAPASVYVITGDDIRRSGKRTLPEALRLAPNLDVAKVNGSQWAISARGFNNVLANKLLVLIDGRSVYTPLYAGVFWDIQDEMLDNIDRIEVISGPGGTLWGANAVNGIINVITKKASLSNGIHIEGGAGTQRMGFGGFRFGGEAAAGWHYRVYGKTSHEANTLQFNGDDASDDWSNRHGGFRVDYDGGGDNTLTVHGDIYSANPNPDATTPTKLNGGNLFGRWDHTGSATSASDIQFYFDRTSRDFGSAFQEFVNTFDLDVQHHFEPLPGHQLTFGAGARWMADKEENLPLFGFFPADTTLGLYSAFVMDHWQLSADRLSFEAGTKYEHNTYTGSEWQPGVRLAWTPAERTTVWGAVTRAVRTPSRIDRDFKLSATPTIALLQGSSDFESETMIAYETGLRIQPARQWWGSASVYYNVYDKIRTAEPGPPPLGVPITLANGVRGTSYGVELSGGYEPCEGVRLRPGYVFFHKNLEVKPGSNDANKASAESDDPANRFQVHGSFDLPWVAEPGRLELDALLWYADLRPSPEVPRYFGLDLRLGWSVNDAFEIALVGQNLLETHHKEFIPSSPSPRELQRGMYGTFKVSM